MSVITSSFINDTLKKLTIIEKDENLLKRIVISFDNTSNFNAECEIYNKYDVHACWFRYEARLVFYTPDKKQEVEMHQYISNYCNTIHIDTIDLSNVDLTDISKKELRFITEAPNKIIIHNNVIAGIDKISNTLAEGSIRRKEINLFNYCTNIKQLDLSGCTLQVNSLRNFLTSCDKLEEVDLTGIEIEDSELHNGISIDSMFGGCNSLRRVDFTPLLKYDKYISSMQSTFDECSHLREIKGLEQFTFENVQETRRCFANCNEIESINLSNATFSKVTRAIRMFKHCFKLKYLDLRNTTPLELKATDEMFLGCNRLEELHIENCYKQKYIGKSSKDMFKGLNKNCMIHMDKKLELNYYNFKYKFDNFITINIDEYIQDCYDFTKLIANKISIDDGMLMMLLEKIKNDERSIDDNIEECDTHFILMQATDEEIETYKMKCNLLQIDIIKLPCLYVSYDEISDTLTVLSNEITYLGDTPEAIQFIGNVSIEA